MVYGVPAKLDLSPLVGSRIVTVGVGLFNTEFSLEIAPLRYGGVNAEGRWEVLDAGGNIVGGRERGIAVVNVPFDQVLGATVTAFSVTRPVHFDLSLSTGLTLRFHDDSDVYESMTVHPGDYVI